MSAGAPPRATAPRTEGPAGATRGGGGTADSATGAATGMATGVAMYAIGTDNFDLGDAATAGLIGAASGAVGGAVAGGKGFYVRDAVTGTLMGGIFGGFAQGLTSYAITQAATRAEFKIGEFFAQGSLGALVGAGSAFATYLAEVGIYRARYSGAPGSVADKASDLNPPNGYASRDELASAQMLKYGRVSQLTGRQFSGGMRIGDDGRFYAIDSIVDAAKGGLERVRTPVPEDMAGYWSTEGYIGHIPMDHNVDENPHAFRSNPIDRAHAYLCGRAAACAGFIGDSGEIAMIAGPPGPPYIRSMYGRNPGYFGSLYSLREAHRYWQFVVGKYSVGR